MAVPTSAPTRVPSCHRQNKVSPVAQNAYRWARRVVWEIAIAVVSSMTKCAVQIRASPRGRRISASGTP